MPLPRIPRVPRFLSAAALLALAALPAVEAPASETNCWRLASAWTNDAAGASLLEFASTNADRFASLDAIQRVQGLRPDPELAFRLLEEMDGIPFSEAETDGGVFIVSIRSGLYKTCMNHSSGDPAVPMFRFLARELGRNRARMIPRYAWDHSCDPIDDWDFDEHPEKRIAFEGVQHTNWLQRTLRDVDILMVRAMFGVREAIPPEASAEAAATLLGTLADIALFSKEERKALLEGRDVPPTPVARRMQYSPRTSYAEEKQ
jgi:hypothetical protein